MSIPAKRVNDLVIWEGVTPDTEDVDWTHAQGQTAYVQVLGTFSRVALEGTLDREAAPLRLAVLTPGVPLIVLPVPLFIRPRVLEGERVTILMYFPEGRH